MVDSNNVQAAEAIMVSDEGLTGHSLAARLRFPRDFLPHIKWCFGGIIVALKPGIKMR